MHATERLVLTIAFYLWPHISAERRACIWLRCHDESHGLVNSILSPLAKPNKIRPFDLCFNIVKILLL
jgi:hypothetical protein